MQVAITRRTAPGSQTRDQCRDLLPRASKVLDRTALVALLGPLPRGQGHATAARDKGVDALLGARPNRRVTPGTN